MAKQVSQIERAVSYVIDKIFLGIMILLYGRHLSETKAQKLTRWLLVSLAVIGMIVICSVARTLRGPATPSYYIPP